MDLPQYARFPWLDARGILGGRAKATVVICPTSEMPAEVALDLNHGIESCSRWRKKHDCSQSCMRQLEFSDEDLDGFAARCEGKKCASCGAVLTRDDWYKSRLAALDTETGTLATPETLRPKLFSDPQNIDPICSTCYRTEVDKC